MRNRIIFSLIVLASVFYMPWWIVATLSLIGVYLYNQYYEIILFGGLIDLLYGSSSMPLGGIYGLLGATFVYYVASYAKNRVRKV